MRKPKVTHKNSKSSLQLSSLLWDTWCIGSIIGIWPRFIEPNLISTSTLNFSIRDLPPDLDNLKIIQFSDLHLNSKVSKRFLGKLSRKINNLKPDIIVFTGDFLSYSQLNEPERLLDFLCSLKAPYGCFASLGNHDYQRWVSINQEGEYDDLGEKAEGVPLLKGFARLTHSIHLKNFITERARLVDMHHDLVNLISKTPFKLLHNTTEVVRIGNSGLNICGLGEYMLGRFDPQAAFKTYDPNYPGIILSHNPDTGPKLTQYPGEIILAGHTHGGQVNLPILWKRFTLLEDMRFKKGLCQVGDKWMYVNRGIGSTFAFRWFAMPELLLLTLKKAVA